MDEVKATLQEMRRRRHEAQPQGIRTFGSTFKNPDEPAAGGRTAGMLLEASGCAGLAVGGARFAPKHANFIENTGSAPDIRRRRADGGGPPARVRALRRGAGAGGPHARSGALSLAPVGDGAARSKNPAVDRSLNVRPAIALPWRHRRRRRHLRREFHPPRALRRTGALIVGVLARRRVRIALLCALAAALVVGGGWWWFRKSEFVSVRTVHVIGAGGPQAHAVEAALRSAARGMSTLDLNTASLRAAVAQFPLVRGLHASAHFPHTLVITLDESPPVAALVVGGAAHRGRRRRARPRSRGRDRRPADHQRPRQPQPGQSVHEGAVLTELAVLGAAPAALAAQVARVYTGSHGLTVAMRNGLLVYFGDAARAHAKWLALERVLLDEGSAGATYVDVRLPERAAAGGFPGDSPPPVSSPNGGEATATDPATEASVAALAEGLRASSPDTASGSPVGANEPSDGSSAPSSGGDLGEHRHERTGSLRRARRRVRSRLFGRGFGGRRRRSLDHPRHRPGTVERGRSSGGARRLSRRPSSDNPQHQIESSEPEKSRPWIESSAVQRTLRGFRMSLTGRRCLHNVRTRGRTRPLSWQTLYCP